MNKTTRSLLSICALYAVSLVAPSISHADDRSQQPSLESTLQQTQPSTADAGIQQPSLQQTPSQQSSQSPSPTQLVSEENCDEVAEENMQCISDIRGFIEIYDNPLEVIGLDPQTGHFIRGTKKYGTRDKKITPYELILPMVDVALMNDGVYNLLPNINDPASARNQMRNSRYYPMRINLFEPLDINEDGVLSYEDDTNGDGLITSEDKEQHNNSIKKLKERKKPQIRYVYDYLLS